MADLSSTDLAYAAGIIDGEGYIGIVLREAGKDKRPGRENSTASFRTVVNVGMADIQVVNWMKETFGGKVYSYDYGKKGVHHWKLTGNEAAEFCSLIAPYLKLKRNQAELLMAFRADTRINHTRRGGHGVVVPLEEIELKRDYVSQIRSLNQREAVL